MSYDHQHRTDRADASRKVRHTVAALLACTALFAYLPSASAQSWDVGPIFEIGVLFDDNPRLLDDVIAENDTGALLNLGADMRRRTERSTVMFRPQINLRKWSEDSDADSEDILLKFLAENTGLRSNWRIGIDFAQEQVLRGEAPTSDFDDPNLDDSVTGTVSVREQRERDKWQIQPGVTLNLSERNAVKVNLTYLDIQYDSQTLGQAVDFSRGLADVAFSRRLTDDSNFEVGVFVSEFETATNFNTTTTAGLRARYSKTITDTSSLYFEAGYEDADIELTDGAGTVVDRTEEGILFRTGWDRRWERSRFRMSVDHGQSPNGSGFIVERTQGRAALDRRLTERLTLRLSAVVLTSETLGTDNVAVNELDFFEAAAGLNYELNRKWSVRGTYTFNTREEQGDIDRQESNGLILSIAYTPEFQQR